MVRSGQVRSECLTCTFRASCCSARLSRAQVPGQEICDVLMFVWFIVLRSVRVLLRLRGAGANKCLVNVTFTWMALRGKQHALCLPLLHLTVDL